MPQPFRQLLSAAPGHFQGPDDSAGLPLAAWIERLAGKSPCPVGARPEPDASRTPARRASMARPAANLMAISEPKRGPRGFLLLAGIIYTVCSEPPDRWEGGDEHPADKLGFA